MAHGNSTMAMAKMEHRNTWIYLLKERWLSKAKFKLEPLNLLIFLRLEDDDFLRFQIEKTWRFVLRCKDGDMMGYSGMCQQYETLGFTN